MNYASDDAYRSMLSSFRTNDLQALLGAFGRNRAGRKSELKDRAVELLRSRPTGFNYPAYLAKIVEIYHTMQNDVPNSDMLRNMMQTQQRQMQMSMNMQAQQRMFQPQQYSQQSMHLTRAGLPQVMPQMQRGMYGSGNIQYSYQRAGRNILPANNQLNLVSSNQLTYVDINAAPSVTNNYTQRTHSLANIRLKKLPFYTVLEEVVRPTTLVGQERCSLTNIPRGMREASFRVALLINQINHISLHRDITGGKAEYVNQIQIRICVLETGTTEITDCMPLGLHIRIGNKTCPLPPTAPNTRPGTEARRIPRPINCTQLFKLNPNIPNTITINWNPDGKTYVFAMNVVKKLSSECLLQKLKDKGAWSSEETRNYIIKKFGEFDPDLATTSYRFTLVCPLGKMRMKIPAKSINCDHLQCFDASIFILMNEKKPTWTCPTCNKPCLYDDIQIQSYFLEIVSDPNLPDSCKDIEFLPDGTWKVFIEKSEAKDSNETKEPSIDSVNLDSDDETSSEAKKEHKPEILNSLKESESLKSSFVDLTLSDEDETPRDKEKDKQENEALAVDAVEPVTTEDPKPQALVQPQQAVTSSEQGVVIEIDSPSPPASPALVSNPTLVSTPAPTSLPTPLSSPTPTPTTSAS